jgi:SAM-dependent methyltransferase
MSLERTNRDTPLYELDGVNRFSDRAEEYARGRPSYPAESLRWILQAAGVASPSALDIGAGTGIATRLLARQGARVTAVDPNAAMVAVGRRESTERWVCGRGESLPFDSASFDLVTVFNAFHWLQPPAAMPEMRRVLRASGRLAVVWNDWDESDECTRDFVRLMRSYAGDHPPEDREAEVAPLYESREFQRVERRDFANVHVMTRQGLHDRIGSVGYIPRGEPWTSEIHSRIEQLFDRHAHDGGTVAHHYTTCVFTAEPIIGVRED